MCSFSGYLHVLADGERRKQRASGTHPGIAFDLQTIFGRIGARIDTKHLDLALVRRAQADDRAHQHRLPVPNRRPPENFSRANVEVEPLVYDLVTDR